ncbi:phosphocholine cytidylyltransferase family protein [Parachlamydia sp. AcF125]|uniref:phosphocholine cytidylyltransferase family protein n=1 Tax=Parachlamydia sp. AcF125 TaxID=2795736 RepID=UPI001BCA5346|nr:phosphocholine cytidylyltransferase family protein [Parachlamydia sp. AcF125]MBS4167536.1 Bifunctional protein GlmU [Parachlamydia sp. AcF125]
MKAVILAAGAGKRLGNEQGPKPLTKLLNGKTILELQLERLAPYFSVHDTLIVVGYQKEKVLEAFPEALFVYNSRFAEENTAKSLWRAFRKIEEDVLWMNGDVVFRPSVLQKVLACQATCMAVNIATVGGEEVKYRTHAGKFITQVSKEVEDPEGEAVGINFMTKKDLPLFRENLARCPDKEYFEKAIQWCIDAGMQVAPVKIAADECVEVDFPGDLEKANQLITSWAQEERLAAGWIKEGKLT